MKAYLMHQDRDFDLSAALAPNGDDLAQDLGLRTIWETMAQGDKTVYELCRRAFLLPLVSPAEIAYRQDVLADCLANSDLVRQLYQLATDALVAERKVWGLSTGSPQLVLNRAVGALSAMAPFLKRLHQMAAQVGPSFNSSGFRRFFPMLVDELDDNYLVELDRHLQQLRFNSGMLTSWRLGEGLSAVAPVLRSPRNKTWREKLTLGRPGFSFDIPPRDDAGAQVLESWRTQSLVQVADATVQSADHVKSFFNMVRCELAFYVGCLNLQQVLQEKAAAYCRPQPTEGPAVALAGRGLYDIGLALRYDGKITSNDIAADDQDLLLVTGANQGGKSTFLRSLGIAQLMMQSGAFVPAGEYRANCATAVFTHFKREEDETMTSGKFDEELRRMSSIVAQARSGAFLLCNESFASTNEQEGSEVAIGIVKALVGAGVKVAFVTHMFELARRAGQEVGRTLYLRAERLDDGRRTFRVVVGSPEPTSHGEDSYWRIFGRSGVEQPDHQSQGEPVASPLFAAQAGR